MRGEIEVNAWEWDEDAWVRYTTGEPIYVIEKPGGLWAAGVGLDIGVEFGPYHTAGDAMRAVDASLRELGMIG